MRVANPRQGDFAEPDQGFKGKGPGLAHLPHRCGTSFNAAIFLRFPGCRVFREL